MDFVAVSRGFFKGISRKISGGISGGIPKAFFGGCWDFKGSELEKNLGEWELQYHLCP